MAAESTVRRRAADGAHSRPRGRPALPDPRRCRRDAATHQLTRGPAAAAEAAAAAGLSHWRQGPTPYGDLSHLHSTNNSSMPRNTVHLRKQDEIDFQSQFSQM